MASTITRDGALRFGEVRQGRQIVQLVSLDDLRWAKQHVAGLAERKGVKLTLSHDGEQIFVSDCR